MKHKEWQTRREGLHNIASTAAGQQKHFSYSEKVFVVPMDALCSFLSHFPSRIVYSFDFHLWANANGRNREHSPWEISSRFTQRSCLAVRCTLFNSPWWRETGSRKSINVWFQFLDRSLSAYSLLPLLIKQAN